MFEQRDGALYFSCCGERVCVQALGRDGLRVRATMEPRFSEEDRALAGAVPHAAEIEIGEGGASVRSGRIRCTVTPLMRTMFFEFPEDEACWNCADQYMFGARYLVAPVLYEGMRARSVYLPAGRWKNIHTGEELAGGRTVTAEAPLDVIPVFEKLG